MINSYIHESEFHKIPSFKDKFAKVTAIVWNILLFAFRSLVIFPAAAIFLFSLFASNFSFTNMALEYYQYISDVSQEAAPKGMVNILSCSNNVPATFEGAAGLPPKPTVCASQFIDHVTIQDAANETGILARKLYLFLAFFGLVILALFSPTSFKISAYLNHRQANNLLKENALKNRIKFSGYYRSLSIGGLLVSEFGYLLRYYTDGKLDSFEDFQKICDENKYNQLIENIDEDIKSGNPRESNVGMTTKEQAISNLENLKMIINAICSYSALCSEKEIPVPRQVY